VLYIKYYEYKNKSQIINVKTGETIKSATIFASLYNLMFDNTPGIKRLNKLVETMGDFSLIYQIWVPTVHCNVPGKFFCKGQSFVKKF
jgi:hypothetical protein